MNVFIQSIGGALPTAPVKKPAAPDPAEKSNFAEPASSEESIEASLKLRALTENVLASPMVDTAHVQRVSNAIASGQYQIDPEHAAQRMMELEALAP